MAPHRGFVRAARSLLAIVGLCLTSALASVAQAQTLPPEYSASDVGNPPIAGSAVVHNGYFSIAGSGADIGGQFDQFMFVHRQMTGDGVIIARVASLLNTSPWAKAGVMVRESLSPRAPNAFMLVMPAKGIAFQRRGIEGGSTATTGGGNGKAPIWVKVERLGSTFTASWSADGASWTVVGRDSIEMSSTVHVGLAVTSQNVRKTATALFSDVTVYAGAPTASLSDTFEPLPVTSSPENQLPTVSLTAPANGSTYTAPASVTVSASASDADGTIAAVEFYAGSTLIGSRSTSPYSVTWSVSSAGTYSLTAIARDNTGATTTSAARSVTVSAAANQPPTVSLTAPVNGSTYTAPASVTVSASASDADGTIAAVDFYAGTTLIGSKSTSPYSVSWSMSAAGTYSLTAVARDNSGATTTSAAHTVTVTAPNQPPAVSLTAPANGATFTTPATVAVSASASDADGTIAAVDFYVGATLIGSDTTSPYSVTWNVSSAGTYTFIAVARDNGGATTASSGHTVTVSAPANQPPAVSLTSPGDGATYTAPASITLSVTASDPDGSVSRVDFYEGGRLIGYNAKSPFGIVWDKVQAGTYSLTAIATDNAGATTVSAQRTVLVKEGQLPGYAVFVPSSNHVTDVTSYLLSVFPAGADPKTANPVATQDLGKPPVVNGECTADISGTVTGLPSGTYVAVVTAVGAGGSAQSEPSPTFTR